MNIILNPSSIEDYHKFLRIKQMPTYRISGREAFVPDEYVGLLSGAQTAIATGEYQPWPGLFDYQRDIAKLAIRKRKFCVFADPGLGKTFIMGECVRHATPLLGGKRSLIVSPLMVVGQTLDEFQRFYGDALQVVQVRANELQAWLDGALPGDIAITNFEAITEDLRPGLLGALLIDESSMMKSHYGKWGTKLIELGKGLEWKFCFTGTPAPNDRIEYGNHAVFMDAFPNVNSFLARYFVNRGQTNERWELRPHAHFAPPLRIASRLANQSRISADFSTVGCSCVWAAPAGIGSCRRSMKFITSSLSLDTHPPPNPTATTHPLRCHPQTRGPSIWL